MASFLDLCMLCFRFWRRVVQCRRVFPLPPTFILQNYYVVLSASKNCAISRDSQQSQKLPPEGAADAATPPSSTCYVVEGPLAQWSFCVVFVQTRSKMFWIFIIINYDMKGIWNISLSEFCSQNYDWGLETVVSVL